MSTIAEEQEQIRTRIREFTSAESDEQERLLNAVEDVPFRDLDEIQTENNIIIGARIFERELADEFNAVGMQMSPLSSWIRGHLEFVGEDYIHRMWKRFVFFTQNQIPAYNYGSYDAFRTHIWKLDEQGLVTPTRKAPASAPGRKDHQYYALVGGMEDNPAWENVTGSMYPNSTPTNVTETIDQQILEAGGEPELEDVAAALDMDVDQLTTRLDQWSIDLSERTVEVLNTVERQ